MNKKKTLITSILMVLVIGLIITGSSFAYFQWSLGYASGTGVNVTIEHGGITMHIEPEATEFVGLYPTADCLTNHRYADALVTIVNNTGSLAIPSFKLKVRVTKGGSGELTSGALSHINYAVVPIETTKNIFGRPVKGDIGSYSCNNTPSGNDADDANTNGYDLLFSQAYLWSTRLIFESVSTNGSWSHIPNKNDSTRPSGYPIINDSAYLPRQYYLSDGNGEFQKGDVNGITFRGEAYSTTYQYFRVYVWIDEGYTTTTIGNVVSDPLQNAKIEITWSEESMVQQVSGESSEQAITAGLYDGSGNYTSWDTLVDNGDITVVNNDITDSDKTLTGTLVISDEITGVGAYSFNESSLNKVIFNPKSQLDGVGISQYAFMSSSITSINIPVGVTEISASAFTGSSLTSITFAENSQLTMIREYAFDDTNLTSIEIPDGVTSIGTGAFSNAELLSVTIPASVTEIGWSAFSGTTRLTDVTFKGTVSEWNAITKDSSSYEKSALVKISCSDGIVTIRQPGLYEESGILSSTWDSLMNNGDITVEDNVITTSNTSLTGELVIPEGIVSIGGFSPTNLTSIYVPSSVTSISGFYDSYLEIINFDPNSQLTSIDSYAFMSSDITSIRIPAGVTSIGDSAFEKVPLSSITFEGTVEEWNAITKGENWNLDVPATKVVCSDGEVSL